METIFNHKLRVDSMLVLLLQAVCLAVIFSLGLLLDSNSVLSTLYVQDGVNYINEAYDYSRGGHLREILEIMPPSVLLTLLNVSLLEISPVIFPIFNLFLLVIATRSFTSGQAIQGLLLFLMVPYYLLSFSLPSKDILTFALFSILAVRLFRPQAPCSFLEICFWSTLVFYVRDGFGLVMFGAATLIYLGRKLNISARWLVVVAMVSALGLEFVKDSILSAIAVGDRAWITESSAFSDAIGSGAGGYFVRFVGNTTNLAFRPVFVDINGGIPALGIAYFISGVSLVVALALFVDRLFRAASSRDQYIAAFGLAGMLGLSLSPFVQGRYLLPLVGLSFLMESVSSKRVMRYFCVVTVLSLLASLVYQQLPNYPPPYETIEFSLSKFMNPD